MLSVERNHELTAVGKGTPMGELMRRYWHPVAATAELDERPTKSVRLLGEDLVLYKDRSGTLGLIDALCPHRRVDMSYGIPEEHGLRCMYHGWMFNETGQCIEQPFEETVHPDGRFKEKVKIAGYPVEELAGLVFAYLGPLPAPLVPRWEALTWTDGYSDISLAMLPCNWLQCQENSLDPVHLEWNHGYWSMYQMGLLERESTAKEQPAILPRAHQRIGFDVFDRGMIKRRIVEGSTEADHDWAVGHPAVFPNILFVGDQVKCNFQFRVPVDDETTLHITWFFYRGAPGTHVERQNTIPFWYVPLYDDRGRVTAELVNHQDFAAWVTQEPIADRSKEILGESDRGIILYRKLLQDQMALVADGGDPMNTIRSEAENEAVALPLEGWPTMMNTARYTDYVALQDGEPVAYADDIRSVLATWASVTPEALEAANR
ncbi:MAG: aromatic ring-hydroxylating dioxygenase subunit alpha [Chloroflexi bacterium]|nr:aromatic ring-hydroxylating dioxygenase subunit alpha [Chloroflexota bacterium]